MILHYNIEKTLIAPMPLRVFLRQKGISQALWRSLKHNGTVTVDGRVVNLTKTMLSGGEDIVLTLPEKTNIIPVKLPLEIIYEDDYVLIINKPVGQLVHPVGSDIDNTVGNVVMGYYAEKGLSLSFHPVHRLDRNTTGLVLIAKQPNIQHLLTTGAKRLFQRQYLAVVAGTMMSKSGKIDLPLTRKPDSIIEQQVSADGKPAVTYYETIDVSSDNQFSLLKLTLETGRTHQIRVHLSHLGHPLLGDDLYGGNHELIYRQALHAFQLELIHPVTGNCMYFLAPLPADFLSLLEKTGLSFKNQE